MAALITLARAKENDILNELSDTKLTRLIALMSEWLYNYIVLPTYADLDDVPEVIQESVCRLMVVSEAHETHTDDYQSESLKDYSYSKAGGAEVGSVLVASHIKELLIGYQLKMAGTNLPVAPELSLTDYEAPQVTGIWPH